MIDRNLSLLKQQNKLLSNLKTISESDSTRKLDSLLQKKGSTKNTSSFFRGSTMINIKRKDSHNKQPNSHSKSNRKQSNLMISTSLVNRNKKSSDHLEKTIMIHQKMEEPVVISEISSSSRSFSQKENILVTSSKISYSLRTESDHQQPVITEVSGPSLRVDKQTDNLLFMKRPSIRFPRKDLKVQ